MIFEIKQSISSFIGASLIGVRKLTKILSPLRGSTGYGVKPYGYHHRLAFFHRFAAKKTLFFRVLAAKQRKNASLG
jgi:hypothetical protein